MRDQLRVYWGGLPASLKDKLDEFAGYPMSHSAAPQTARMREHSRRGRWGKVVQVYGHDLLTAYTVRPLEVTIQSELFPSGESFTTDEDSIVRLQPCNVRRQRFARRLPPWY